MTTTIPEQGERLALTLALAAIHRTLRKMRAAEARVWNATGKVRDFRAAGDYLGDIATDLHEQVESLDPHF